MAHPFAPWFAPHVPSVSGGLLTDEFGHVRWKKLSADSAYALWLRGANFIAITPEGAKRYLASASQDDRVAFLALCKTPAEVDAVLYATKPLAALKKRAAERLIELGFEPTPESTEGSTSTRKRS